MYNNRRPVRSGSYNGNFRSRRPAMRHNGGAQIHESRFISKGISIAETPVFIPKIAFADLPIDAQLKRNIISCGFQQPTAIQDGTILPILEGKDVIGVANTGTGKTAAFLIPLLDKLVRNPKENVLIVVPTRELAAQIRDEMRAISNSMRIYISLCVGGSSIRDQIYELRRNPHFVVGTPGRLKDLIERKVLNISNFGTIVLDEVDRMLDMGFIHDIKQLIALLPKERQSLFFSATISPEITNLIRAFTTDPLTISVKTHDTSKNVDQDVIRVDAGNKMDMLEDLLKKDEFKKVLIFGRTKHGVERLSVNLFKKGFKVTSIHGDKPQSKRTQAIRLFKENVVSILVATDVASRGIDIADITHVINYDTPATYEDYVHRIGRTGRANKTGVALTFVG